MRFSIVIVALLVSSVSHADEFGGWKFTAPPGTRTTGGDHVMFTKITGKTFCQFALFTARPLSGGDGDAANEWETIVAKNFTPSNITKPTMGKARSLDYITISATLEQKDKGTFAGTLYILGSGNAFGSLLVTSSTAATLAKCPTKALLDSIVLTSVPSAAPAPAPPPAAPAANAADSIVGTWGGGWGNPASRYGTAATMRRQYSFAADGTYTYRSELYNGVNEWILVRESGKYSIVGDQLTIAPTSSTISSRDWNKVKSSKKNALEKVTYAFRKHYFEGIQEWNLVLTPPKETQRDGAFAANDQFRGSYLLTNNGRQQFKWP